MSVCLNDCVSVDVSLYDCMCVLAYMCLRVCVRMNVCVCEYMNVCERVHVCRYVLCFSVCVECVLGVCMFWVCVCVCVMRIIIFYVCVAICA